MYEYQVSNTEIVSITYAVDSFVRIGLDPDIESDSIPISIYNTIGHAPYFHQQLRLFRETDSEIAIFFGKIPPLSSLNMGYSSGVCTANNKPPHKNPKNVLLLL